MGTSFSPKGPTGSNPLLPPWAPDLDPESVSPPGAGSAPDSDADESVAPAPDVPVPDLERLPSWSSLHSNMTRLATSGATGRSAATRARRIGREYVERRGGARSAARGSVAARVMGPRLVGFLADVARYGVDRVLRNLQLEEYIGQPIDDLLVALAQTLVPSPNSVDDTAARTAALETFHELLQQYGAYSEGLRVLDALDADAIQAALEHFIARYVTTDLLARLSKRVEDGSDTVERCDELLSVVRSVILETIRLDLRGRDVLNIDWNGSEGRQFIERQLFNAYQLLEGA